MLHRTVLAAALVFATVPAFAADYSDPTWPCIQRKVERLSLGLMWPHPVPETQPENADLRAQIGELAGRLALRRLDLETLGPEVSAFAAANGGDPALLGLVFQSVFDSLSQRRSRIIGGIGDFSLGQIALTERIEAARIETRAEMDKPNPDFDRVDALEEQLDWDQLIYSDRQKSIEYLCETPTLLERRLFEIAQLLLNEASDS